MTPWQLRMRQARGLESIDLVLHSARLVNVLSGEIYETDIGIHEGFLWGRVSSARPGVRLTWPDGMLCQV